MLILLASGSVVGMLLGIAASRVLSAIVCQASAHDPFVLASVVLPSWLGFGRRSGAARFAYRSGKSASRAMISASRKAVAAPLSRGARNYWGRDRA